ncbi:hypothetical protein PROFUN_05648 [Planoprotostelium fungivorum]|uniref:Transmembrane protein n=1 Tax=Planoprotostelium fungivorum TaxID=1890364 RepID=A0A2P6MUH2_9EUKA|nr:hypothetical protein PROFUN_05648 [Planoprotostelium fungivorum]
MTLYLEPDDFADLLTTPGLRLTRPSSMYDSPVIAIKVHPEEDVHEIEPMSWRELSGLLLRFKVSLIFVIVIPGFLCIIPYCRYDIGDSHWNPVLLFAFILPFSFICSFSSWLYLPFNLLILSLSAVISTAFSPFHFTREERKELHIKASIKAHRKAYMGFPLFYVVSVIYIISFGYADTTAVQIFVNILFGFVKYAFKWFIYDKYSNRCGFLIGNFVVLVMDTIHQLFCTILFISHANLVTIVVNVSIEMFAVVRMGLAASSWKLIVTFKLNKYFPSSKLSTEVQRQNQVGYLCMVILANIITMIGSLSIVISTRIFDGGCTFPFGDAGLSKISRDLHLGPLPSAVLVICGTQGLLIINGIITLNVVKFSYKMHTVTDSLRLYKGHPLLMYGATIVAFAYVLGNLIYDLRVYSWFSPDAYNR